MKAPITTAQAMSHPDVVLTINALGKMADELRAENRVLRDSLTRLRHWAEADNVHYTGDHPVALAREALTRSKS